MTEVWKVILTSTVVTTVINVGWKYYESKKSFKDKRYLQINNYYRESSGKEMHKILKSWTEMLFLMEDPKVKKRLESTSYILSLINDTYLYSSPKTCLRLSNYQHYAYNELDSKNKDHIDSIVLVAGIITSLKHDFTGDWVSIEDTLRIKLTDYENGKDKIKQKIRSYNYDIN